MYQFCRPRVKSARRRGEVSLQSHRFNVGRAKQSQWLLEATRTVNPDGETLPLQDAPPSFRINIQEIAISSKVNGHRGPPSPPPRKRGDRE